MNRIDSSSRIQKAKLILKSYMTTQRLLEIWKDVTVKSYRDLLLHLYRFL